MEPKPKEKIVDDWVTNIDQIILSIITKDPTKWFRFYVSFCFIILFFGAILSIVVNNFVTLSNEDFYTNLLLSYTYLSLLSGMVGVVSFAKIRRHLKTLTSTEKLKKFASYFKLLWIIGAIQAPIIYLIVSLGHVDCGSSCVASVEANDLASYLFYVTWVVVPFYLWMKIRQMIKPDKSDETQVSE